MPSSPEAARSPETNPLVPSSPEGVKESLSDTGATSKKKTKTNPSCHPLCGGTAPHDHSRGQHTHRHRSNLQEKNNIVIPEFSAWLTLVLEQCRAENIRNLPRQRAPTPLFPERRPREACSMPISGCHDLPLATFNLPSRVFRHGCRRAGKFRNDDRGGRWEVAGRGAGIKKIIVIPEFSFRASGRKISGISAARRA